MLEDLVKFLQELRERKLRGLAVVEVDNIEEIINNIVGLSKKILVVSQEEFQHNAITKIVPEQYQKVLGHEFDYVIIDCATYEKLRPNMLCAVSETICAGGSLIIAVKNFEKWNPGLDSRFSKYLKDSILECEAHIVLTRSGVLSYSIPGRKAFSHCFNDVLTIDQRRAVELFDNFLKIRGKKAFLLSGGRGRGKTFLLGVLAVRLFERFDIPQIELVCPYEVPEAFLRGVRSVLHCEVEYRDRRIVTCRDFEIVIRKPGERCECPFVLVDEASCVGVARVRRLLARTYKVVMTLTTFGYEGSGRYFAVALERELGDKAVKVELQEPVRYLKDDPLEMWLNKTFVLSSFDNVHHTNVDLEKIFVRKLDKEELLKNRDLFRKIVSVLRDAHYRHCPDDLVVLLDSDEHMLYVVQDADGRVLAAAHVRIERVKTREMKKAQGGVPLAGLVLGTVLARYGSSRVAGLKIARVHRIAVVPELQRRGIGSRLLKFIEKDLEKRFDIIGAVFGRSESLDFWLKNGYVVCYISPRFNKVTGEHNIAVVKPLSKRGEEALRPVLEDFKRRLVLLCSSVYRDVDSEIVTKSILSLRVTSPIRLSLSSMQQRRLEIFLKNIRRLEIEYVQDVVYEKLVMFLLNNDDIKMEYKELLALITKVLQGKSIKEIAATLRCSMSEAKSILKRAVHALLVGW